MLPNRPWASATVALIALAIGASATPQPSAHPPPGTLTVLMLSDLHFDPFRDPAKVPALAGASPESWDRILHQPASPAQAQDYAALETACKPRGGDTSLALLDASLTGARTQAPAAGVITVSGDLLVHQFDCRYRHIMKGKDAGLSSFAEKTASYTVQRIEQAFPNAAVYVALGNNDSGCGDYRIDSNDPFLARTAEAVAHGWREAGAAEAKKARTSYEHGGYYAISLSGMPHTRLLVLNTTYLSNKGTNCAGEKDDRPARTEIAWLRAELDAAQAHEETAWVLGHIPPGVDVYSTLRHLRTMCSAAPETFLATDALAKALEDHAGVLRLGVFGHTHTDELRLLGNVPLKLVGSVTPINGNTPSFTIAQVNPATATLEDFAVFTASNTTGLATTWTREYGFRQAYAAKDFSASSLRTLIATFRTQPDGLASAEYQRDFFGGEGSPLPLVWTQYVCALDHPAAPAFHDCLCPGP